MMFRAKGGRGRFRKKNDGISRLSRGYRNPKIYRSQGYRPAQGKSNLKFYIFIYLASVLLVGLILFLFVSDYFKIDNIVVLGNQDISSEDIELALDDYLDSSKIIIFKNNNIFMFRPNEAGDIVKDKLDMVRDIKITKKFPRTIKVDILERKPELVWQTKDTFYLVDNRGYAYRQTESRGDLPLVKDIVGVDLNIEKTPQVVTPEFVSFVKNMVEDIKGINIEISSVEIGEVTLELSVITNNNLKIIFDTTGSLDGQIDRLKKVLEQYGKDIHEYIDLRIENKVFFK